MSGHTQPAAAAAAGVVEQGADGMAEGHTQCPLCHDTLSHPLLLPCLHSFCTPCLAGYISSNNSKGQKAESGAESSFLCPVCRTMIAWPDKGADGFMRNHFLASLVELETCQADAPKMCDYCSYEQRETAAESHCLQCNDHLCGSCADAHRRTKLTREHGLVLLSDIQRGKYHEDIRTNQGVVCEAHPGEPLKYFCLKCEALICRECRVCEHEKHQCADPKQVSEGYRKKVAPLLESVRGKMAVLRSQVKGLREYGGQVEAAGQKMAASVDAQAQLLHRAVDKYRQDMLSNITAATQKETGVIEEKQAQTQHVLAMLESAADYMDFCFKRAKPAEILLPRHLVSERLTSLVYTNVEPLTSKLHMMFTAGPSSPSHVHNVYGKLEIYNTPLNTSSPVSRPASSTTSTRPHPPASPAPPVLYNIGERVKLMHSFDCKGFADSKDIWPTGVAIDHSGHIVLVDRENRCVKLFDKNGRLFSEFGKKQLGCPYDVTILPNHNIAVTDHDEEDVKIFMATGDLITTIKGRVKYPRGITHNKRGHIIVVDAHYRRVKVIDPLEGHEIKVIQSKGEDRCDVLNDPYYVTTNTSEHIIVSDWGSPHIKIFTPDGRLTSSYGGYGVSRDQMLQPYGLCTDSQGYIFVADNQNHRIHLLGPDGKFLRFLIGKEHGLWHPMAVAISSQGHLVVTEALGKVKVFKYV